MAKQGRREGLYKGLTISKSPLGDLGVRQKRRLMRHPCGGEISLIKRGLEFKEMASI
jgi:hypothetical protein